MCQHRVGPNPLGNSGTIKYDPIGANMIDFCGENYKLPGKSLFSENHYIKQGSEKKFRRNFYFQISIFNQNQRLLKQNFDS